MKWILFILLFYFQQLLIAQKDYHLGLKAGANLCQINGDNYNRFNKKGFNGGVFFNMGLSKKTTGQLEMLYTQKGCLNYYEPPNDISMYDFRLRYFEFPILFKYHINKISLELGLSTAMLIERRQTLFMINGFGHMTNDNPPNFIDNSFNVGASYTTTNNWILNLRYTNSITPMRRDPPAQYNNMFSLTLAYQFSFQKNKIENEY